MENLAVADYPDQLDELVNRVQSYIPQADTALIRRAYDYSARMHVEQKRKSGEPYVIHPLNVALIIAQLRLDLPSIGSPPRRRSSKAMYRACWSAASACSGWASSRARLTCSTACNRHCTSMRALPGSRFSAASSCLLWSP